jgi:hypothetical protein
MEDAKKEIVQAKKELLAAKTKLQELNDKLMELSDVMQKNRSRPRPAAKSGRKDVSRRF